MNPGPRRLPHRPPNLRRRRIVRTPVKLIDDEESVLTTGKVHESCTEVKAIDGVTDLAVVDAVDRAAGNPVAAPPPHRRVRAAQSLQIAPLESRKRLDARKVPRKLLT